MRHTVIKFGLLSSLLIAVSMRMVFVLGPEEHQFTEWLGYLIMIIGLSIIFVGIKQYRDKELGGVIGFKKAFKIGFLIALIAGFSFVISWEIYYQTAGENFVEGYQEIYISELKAEGLSDDELAEKKSEMKKYADYYQNFFFRIAITFLEIFPVGIIISLISSVLLKTKKS